MEKNRYHDSHIPLKEREKDLFSKITEMDHESLALYQVLFEKRQEKVIEDEILSRLTQLKHLYEELKDGYYYLYAVEEQTKRYATLRALWKGILTLSTTAFAYDANPLLGILSFVALAKMASTQYVQELKAIEEALDQYDCQEQMNTIEKTLGNCTYYAEKPKEYTK